MSKRLGRMIEASCSAFALAGGALLTAMALMAVASILMRWFGGKPVQGDFELVQLGCAASIAAFMPYCQLRRGHIIVDFFTTRASMETQKTLDALGASLLALVAALIAWRTAAGALAVWTSGETTMIRAVPIWYAYAAMVPSFALTAIAGLYTAWSSWRER